MSGGQDRKRIRAFGCSHTAQHQWLWLCYDDEKMPALDPKNEYRLGKYVGIPVDNNYNPCTWSAKNIDMESWAMSGSGFDAQLCMWNTLLLNDDIDKDDIIIFQLTNPHRFTIPINDDSTNYYGARLKEDYQKDRLEQHGCFQLIENEYFTEKNAYGFDPACTYPLDVKKIAMNSKQNVYGQTGRMMEEDPFRLHMVLSALRSIKSFNKKLLVIVGHENSIRKETLSKLFDAFDKFNIDYIKTGIVEYSINNNYGVDKSGHSTQQGYKAFTSDVVKPKLEQLEWI